MILLDPIKCKGCRLCEAACSFHHSGHNFFSPHISSTKISRDNDTANITIIIDSTCDYCEGEAFPFCVKYCAYGARKVRK